MASPIIVENANLVVDVDGTVKINASTNSDADLEFISLNTTVVSVSGENVTGLIGGKVNITVRVKETDRCLAKSTNVSVTVNKLSSIITVENATLTVDADGSANIVAQTNSDAEIEYISLNTTVASVSGNTVTGLIGGKANITLSVRETDKYLANSTNVLVIVNKVASSIEVNESVTLNIDDEASLDARLNHEGTLAYLSGNSSVVTVDDAGKIRGISSGSTYINITFTESEKYLPANRTVLVTVNKVPIRGNPVNITVDENGTATVKVNMSQDATGNVTVNVNGNETKIELTNGTGSATITGLKEGDNQVNVSYTGDDKYAGFSQNYTAHVPVSKLSEKNDLVKLYLDKKAFTVKLTKDDMPAAGEMVNITLNGVTYSIKTDSNGVASLKINLVPKTYEVTAQYRNVTVSSKVTVKHVIQIKNLKVKRSAKKLKIKVTLKKVDGKFLKGKKLKLKFKGKTYTAKTNKKGVATFTIKKNVIKKLKKGKKYKYTVKYVNEYLSKTIKCVK